MGTIAGSAVSMPRLDFDGVAATNSAKNSFICG